PAAIVRQRHYLPLLLQPAERPVQGPRPEPHPGESGALQRHGVAVLRPTGQADHQQKARIVGRCRLGHWSPLRSTRRTATNTTWRVVSAATLAASRASELGAAWVGARIGPCPLRTRSLSTRAI